MNARSGCVSLFGAVLRSVGDRFDGRGVGSAINHRLKPRLVRRIALLTRWSVTAAKGQQETWCRYLWVEIDDALEIAEKIESELPG
jgi:hypothetical protein